MAHSLRELRSLPDDELIIRHDHAAESTTTGVSYYLNELARRETDRATQTMLRCTYAITFMSAVMMVASLISAWAVFYR